MQQSTRLALFAVMFVLLNHRAANAANAPDGSWSTVKGRIVWAGGEIPKREVYKIEGQFKKHVEGKHILKEWWVVNPKNKGVRWTFVWLEPAPKSGQRLPIHPSLKEVPKKEIQVEQKGYVYFPHALAMRQGQTFVVKEAEGECHNVNLTGERDAPGRLLVPHPELYRDSKLKAQRTPYRLTCNVHYWINGHLMVFDHPYFAVTDENGAFEIPLAPKGEWRLKVWHESAGWRGGAAGKNGEPISVTGGKTTDVGDLGLKPGDE